LLPGGAHLTAAVMYASLSTSPSSFDVLAGMLANPASCIALASQSPELSPVNILPVLLPPCAAGASPAINSRAFGSPQLGSGRAQYSSFAKRFTFSCPTCLMYRDSLGHSAHFVTCALSLRSFSPLTVTPSNEVHY
jgi:hypothetical protein